MLRHNNRLKLLQNILLAPNPYQNKIRVFTEADHTSTFDPSWAFSDSSVMTVDWGDGTPKESHATGLSHTYTAGSGRKQVLFSCPDNTKLTEFSLHTDACVLSIPSFSTYTSLSDFRIINNTFSGCIPSFANCTSLLVFYAGYNQLSEYVVGCFTTQKNLFNVDLYANSLTVTSVDAILADLVTSLSLPGRLVATIDLSGVGNAAPSNPAGLASKATLVGAGWTVTTN